MTRPQSDLPFCTFIFCAIPTLFTLFLAYTAAATRATFAAELYLLITLLMIGALMTLVPTLGRPRKVLPLPVDAIWPVVEQAVRAHERSSLAEWERRRANARAGIWPNTTPPMDAARFQTASAILGTAAQPLPPNPVYFRHAFRNTIDPDGLCMQCNCPAGDEIHI